MIFEGQSRSLAMTLFSSYDFILSFHSKLVTVSLFCSFSKILPATVRELRYYVAKKIDDVFGRFDTMHECH